MNRRQVMQAGLAGAVGGAAISSAAAANRAANSVVVGVMGVNGRGADLAHTFAATGQARVAYACDVDERARDRLVSTWPSDQGTPPQAIGDFRRILDDPAVDALVVAAPDHWHGPATILACAAGKHVYVEKPASHNPREGQWMIEAARNHRRVVQVGTQRRTRPGWIEAIARLHGGAIGKPLVSRAWYNNTRGTIGRAAPTAPPAGLDWSLWQGPAPERPFQANVVHYHWHWFWHWGTGELGNNGVHGLDICRWGLGVDCPRRVSAGGGRLRFQDDQETPDTHFVSFDFGDRLIEWVGNSWHPRGLEGSAFGIAFYGEAGSMVIDDRAWRIFDPHDKLVSEQSHSGNDAAHVLNFFECVRTGAQPNADITQGHYSALLCHLGNIAWRTGSTLHLDPQKQLILDNEPAAALWTREYRPGWEPKV